MTVKEFKEVISEYDDSALVVLSSDAEGNKYSPLCEATQGCYVPENTWRGEVYSYDDREEFNNSKPALVLYPVN